MAGFGHWLAGDIDWSIVGWLLLGSIPGVLLGGHLTFSIPEQPLRLLLAGVLGLAGLKLVNVPGASIIIVVVLGAGVTALLVWLGRHSWIRMPRALGRAVRKRPSGRTTSLLWTNIRTSARRDCPPDMAGIDAAESDRGQSLRLPLTFRV